MNHVMRLTDQMVSVSAQYASTKNNNDNNNNRDEFTVKILHSSFCDTKIELRSSWCDLCSSFFFGVLEKKNS